MLRLEGFMEIQKLHHDGLSVSEIARRLDMDRKTVRKYLKQAPTRYERQPKRWKVDPWRSYLRERWEQGVENANRLAKVTLCRDMSLATNFGSSAAVNSGRSVAV